MERKTEEGGWLKLSRYPRLLDYQNDKNALVRSGPRGEIKKYQHFLAAPEVGG